jgi:sugar lactone lactonase YvrE
MSGAGIPRARGTRDIASWLAALLLLAAAGFARAEEYTFITLAGAPHTPGAVDEEAAFARFDAPRGAAVDRDGNIYVADKANHTIRKITPAGTTTTFAGLAGSPGSTNGTGAAARFRSPSAVAVDGTGNVYVADTGNQLIRKITPEGKVTKLAGRAGVSGANDGLGNAARFNFPRGIAVDAAGNVFVGDTGNNTIRKVTPAGQVTTLAGSAGNSGRSDGSGSAARFDFPQGVAVDSLGILYVADTTNNTIRKITPAGAVTTLAGKPGAAGSADGYGGNARFNGPSGVAFRGTNLYVADTYSSTIRVVFTNGQVTTLAGLAGLQGQADGPAYAATFNNPRGVAVDAEAGLYIVDTLNNAIRKLAPSWTNGSVTTLAGPVGSVGSADGPGAAARFHRPAGVALDNAGTLYVADSLNNTIRKVAPDGRVTTLAGRAGVAGSFNGTNDTALFDNPRGVTVTPAGDVIVADTANQVIRKISPLGVVTNLAGQTDKGGGDDGALNKAQFYFPGDVAADATGEIFVADTRNSTIRLIVTNLVFTIAGVGGKTGTNNGAGSDARFNNPQGVAVDSQTNVYVADTFNQVIRKITPVRTSGSVQWLVTTFAGTMGLPGSIDGPAEFARFDYPARVTVDAQGNVYVGDSANQIIRQITPGGFVTTLAGRTDRAGSKDGQGAAARFFNPLGVTLDAAGFLYVADSFNNTIRKISPTADVTTLAGQASFSSSGELGWFNTPGGLSVDTARNAFVANYDNCTIQEVSPDGAVAVVAGLTGVRGNSDGTGLQSTFDHPFAVAVERATNIFVSDTVNCTIRMITIGTNVEVTTLVGKPGAPGSADGTRGSARFKFPCGLAVAGPTNLYVADYGNHTIRKVTPDQYVSTFAGQAGAPGSADGTGPNARFNFPRGVAVEVGGNVFVADTGNHTIRKITPAGVVTTVAGSAGSPGTNDGVGSAARFNFPQSLTPDGAGNLFVADSGNDAIRKITPDGLVTTVGGLAGSPGFADGTGSGARFDAPGGISANAGGRLWVSDSGNNAIRRGVPAAPDRPVISLPEAPVGTVQQLDIAAFSAVGFSWSIVRRPAGSVAQLQPSTSVRNPTFTPDVADLFVFQLSATNAAGQIALRTLSLQGLPQAPAAGSGSGQNQAGVRLVGVSVRSMNAGGQVAVSGLVGTPALPCTLLVSTNLVHWTPLITLTNIAGSEVFLDPISNAPCRFYKVEPLP